MVGGRAEGSMHWGCGGGIRLWRRMGKDGKDVFVLGGGDSQ